MIETILAFIATACQIVVGGFLALLFTAIFFPILVSGLIFMIGTDYLDLNVQASLGLVTITLPFLTILWAYGIQKLQEIAEGEGNENR